MAPEQGFQKLMEQGQSNPAGVKFVSRGDNSGTHGKEKSIWSGAGYEYQAVQGSGEWYVESGVGMGPTLVMANEKSGYTLTDIGTFLAFKKDLDLEPMIDEGDILLNVYSAIAVSPGNAPGTKIDMANNLISFLTSDEIQELIGKYGFKEYGRQLFTPCKGAAVCAN
jgi:tungstate transport system substrate-binding protein